VWHEALEAAGGLGLFLLGMIILSDGLRALAGAAVHRALRRFTRSPSSGALTGALTTAVIQSSSVTTVTAVGFASAGLLTFPQALGIVFGANIGTTITGWMVALVGFKLQLGVVMPVFVLVGVVMRLTGRGRWASLGLTLAGFGLVFMGIDLLRSGTAALEGVITPDQLPGDSIGGRLQLVAVGVLVTLVTQSSSAGVATALSALSVGALEFGQAAALVIGMDMGTTVTAALATIGASLPGRRTGWAHVLYNLFTASIAFVILPAFAFALEKLSPGLITRQPELVLVGFHTFFNSLGVSIMLPFAGPFAHLVERLVPDRPRPFAERLDRNLLGEPEVALRALAPTLCDLAHYSFVILREQAATARSLKPQVERRELLALALDEVQSYLAGISPSPEIVARTGAALHVVDQLRRLLAREAQLERVESLSVDSGLRGAAGRLADALPELLGDELSQTLHESEIRLAALCAELDERRTAYRNTISGRMASPSFDSAASFVAMDAYRWLERTTHHAWRIAHHLGQLIGEFPTPIVAEPPEPD